MSDGFTMRDPTAEAAPARRERCAPPETLDGLIIGLLAFDPGEEI